MNQKKAITYGFLLLVAFLVLFLSLRASGPAPRPDRAADRGTRAPGDEVAPDDSWQDFWRRADALLARTEEMRPAPGYRPVRYNPMDEPKAPPELVDEPETREEEKPEIFVLSAVMLGEKARSAIINRELVREGDAVGRDRTVKLIERDRVVIAGEPDRPEILLTMDDDGPLSATVSREREEDNDR